MPTESEVGSTYPTYGDYVIDAGKWGGELAIEKQRLLDEQASIIKRAETTQQQFSQSYREQATLYSDFKERIADASGTDLGEVITSVITNTPEMAGHLTYWAATHESDVARIKALPPGLQLVEMGKVMAGITAPSKEGAPKNRSRAPAPTGETGRPAGHASNRPEDASNYSDFVARRTAQITQSGRVR